MHMHRYQVDYQCQHDCRWLFFEAWDDEDAAWQAKNWTMSNGYQLIDVKPLPKPDT